ncbi:MAG: MoaD family protein [Thaumarchaeota archaeon]|jgi:molybdopterin synthase sulfur carrier subunit|nr:MoaD family protein [Nitrososphaerota archaeon]
MTGEQKTIITTKYFAALREITGKKEEAFEFNGEVDARKFLEALVARYGKKSAEFLLDQKGTLRESLVMLVNGNAVDTSDLASLKLKNGDLVVILPPIGGGL